MPTPRRRAGSSHTAGRCGQPGPGPGDGIHDRIVTDHHAFADLVKGFAWMIPGKLKLFALAERDAAVEWAAAD
jgi:hypothetical protein